MCAECTSSSPSDEGSPKPLGAGDRQSAHGGPGPSGASRALRIAIVGVCGAGKSTLAAALRQRGFQARQISQEHSGVTRLWSRFWDPDVLVYLEASDVAVARRLGRTDHGDIYRRQRERLALARQECDIYIDTDALTPGEVLDAVLCRLT